MGLGVILTGHVRGFKKYEKYKQLTHKISQQKKISVFENVRIRVDRALVFAAKIASNVSRKLI